MKVKIVTSWRALFRYAFKHGQAALAYKRSPSLETAIAWAEAKKAHDNYVVICLTADRMIDFPEIRGI